MTRRPVRPVLLPALRPQAVGGDAAVPAARHAVRGAPTCAAAGYDVALFDAMLAESEAEWDEALEPRAPRCRRAVRGQLQLPVQDVPAAHARGGVHDDRHGRASAAAP